MIAKLRKPLRRSLVLEGRPVVVTLYPDGRVQLRRKGGRRLWHVQLDSIFHGALRAIPAPLEQLELEGGAVPGPACTS